MSTITRTWSSNTLTSTSTVTGMSIMSTRIISPYLPERATAIDTGMHPSGIRTRISRTPTTCILIEQDDRRFATAPSALDGSGLETTRRHRDRIDLLFWRC